MIRDDESFRDVKFDIEHLTLFPGWEVQDESPYKITAFNNDYQSGLINVCPEVELYRYEESSPYRLMIGIGICIIYNGVVPPTTLDVVNILRWNNLL